MKNQFPGDFKLTKVTLYNINQTEEYDIKALVREVNIYESIFSPVLHATLLIEDIGQNLISTLPILGQERIVLVIDSGDLKYNLNFYLYRIDGRTMEEKAQVYVMNCMSVEGLRNENYRICERVDGVKSEDMVEDILKRDNFTKKSIIVDDTKDPFDMYVPNWRIFDLIQWMSKRSVPLHKKNSVGFLFYETFEGFNYRSIDKLFDEPVYPDKSTKYTFYQGNQEGLDKGTNEQSRHRIMNYSSPKMFDIYDDLRRGAFSHDSIYLDPLRRVYRTFRTTADDFWDESSHLEKTKPWITGGDSTPTQLLTRSSRTIYRPSVLGKYNAEITELIDNLDEATGQTFLKDWIDPVNKDFEKAFYRYYFLEYSQLDIAVPGDLELTSGNVIKVAIPTPEPAVGGKVNIDKRMSGKYFVTAVKHTILNRSELRTTMTLARDSYGGKALPDITKSEQQVYQDGTN